MIIQHHKVVSYELIISNAIVAISKPFGFIKLLDHEILIKNIVTLIQDSVFRFLATLVKLFIGT